MSRGTGMDERLVRFAADAWGRGTAIDAAFVGRKEFYYSWRVSPGRVELRLSDYLEDAPDDVLEAMVRAMHSRSRGISSDLPGTVTDHMSSDVFISGKRPTYIRRSRNLRRTAVGDCRDLHGSVDRLLDSGLLSGEDIDNSYISWTRQDNRRRVGFCSTMFRVIGISSALDSPSVPEPVLDYVVYHECLHLRQRYHPGERSHDSRFRAWERMYPDWRSMEAILRKL